LKQPMREPRTTREALVAELLGDIDGLLSRAEAMPERMDHVAGRLVSAAQALDEAALRYRQVVNEFTGDARNELTVYLQRKAAELASRTQAPGHEPTSDAAAPVIGRAATPVNEDARGRRNASGCGLLVARLLEHGLTAVLASMLTAALVLLLTR
jgi:hypothetical protein